MIISTDNLNKLRVGFNTAYRRVLGQATAMSPMVSTRVPATQKSQTYGWLGKLPNVREWIGARVVQNITEGDYTIKERPWELTIGVDRDDIETDNLGQYNTLFEEMGNSTGGHIEMLVFAALAAGFTTNCYDGQFYFDTDHPILDKDGNTPTFTVGGVALKLRSFEVTLGNVITPRLLIGYEGILITDRNEQLAARVEAEALGVYNPFTKAQAATPEAVVLEHGTVAGKRVRFDAPYAVVQRLTGYENQDGILEWPLTFSLQPSVGNDQWKITLT